MVCSFGGLSLLSLSGDPKGSFLALYIHMYMFLGRKRGSGLRRGLLFLFLRWEMGIGDFK
jgi:hypothetical protein